MKGQLPIKCYKTSLDWVRLSEHKELQSLEATRVSRLHKINSAKQEVESLAKQMSQAAQFAENMVQGTSSSDIMQNKETLRTKFEELLRVEVPKHQSTRGLQH